MLYLFDENQPPALVAAIRQLHQQHWSGDQVETMRDRGWGGTDDPDWIGALARHNGPWTIVTRDLMHKEWYEVQGSSGTWFILMRGWSSLTYWPLAWKLVKAWPDVVANGRRNPGSVFDVAVNGKINRRR